MTAISDIATRPDLLDRCIILHLPRIKDEQRRPESTFWKAFDAAHGRILGALLTAVSAGLKTLENVQLAHLPRMADFALWAVACEDAMELEPGSFLNRYGVNRADANELALDTSPLPPVLRAFLEAHGGKWQGSASELLDALTVHLQAAEGDRTLKAREWPKRADKLSGTLRRYAPNLRATGLEVEFERTNKQRTILLRTVAGDSVLGVTGVTEVENNDATQEKADDAKAITEKDGVTSQTGVTLSVTNGATLEKTDVPTSNLNDASDTTKQGASKWVAEL